MAIQTLINFSAQTPHQAARLVMAVAKTGHPEAQAQLAQMLLDGKGIKQDQSLGLIWFKLAAKQGHLQAINMVGRCYENGWGTQVDHQQAVIYYQQAADQGFTWGKYNLANLLIKGQGISKNLEHAYQLYHQAAQAGHAKSMNLIGRFHEEGWLVPQNIEIASSWYRRSASAGDFRGQCSYASILTQQGKIDEAVMWLNQSMQTATHGFMQKMARALWQSPHKPLRQLALKMFEQCAEQGDDLDQHTYQQLLAANQ